MSTDILHKVHEARRAHFAELTAKAQHIDALMAMATAGDAAARAELVTLGVLRPRRSALPSEPARS